MFISVSPPNRVMCTTLFGPASRNMKSTLCLAVSTDMNFGCLPFAVSTSLSSPYS